MPPSITNPVSAAASFACGSGPPVRLSQRRTDAKQDPDPKGAGRNLHAVIRGQGNGDTGKNDGRADEVDGLHARGPSDQSHSTSAAMGAARHWVMRIANRGPMRGRAPNRAMSPRPKPITPLAKNHGNPPPRRPSPKACAQIASSTVATPMRARLAVGPPSTRAERAAKITDNEKKMVVRNEGSTRGKGREVQRSARAVECAGAKPDVSLATTER